MRSNDPRYLEVLDSVHRLTVLLEKLKIHEGQVYRAKELFVRRNWKKWDERKPL